MSDKTNFLDCNIEPENRLFKCLGCGFIGFEQEAINHQVLCDNAMERIG